MIYNDMTKRAMKLAFEAHKEQTDKSGLPYIFHPIHVAEQMDTEITTCVALLHDVVEDTNVSFAELGQAGMSMEVIEALKLLTHDESTPYIDYIRCIKDSGNPYVICVKLADLRHNSDVTRLERVDSKAKCRLRKYAEAIASLEE